MPETFCYFTMIKPMLLSVLQKAQRGESILKRNKNSFVNRILFNISMEFPHFRGKQNGREYISFQLTDRSGH